MFWKPTLAVQCDAATFLVEVCSLLDGYSCSTQWVQTLRTNELEKEEENRLATFTD